MVGLISVRRIAGALPEAVHLVLVQLQTEWGFKLVPN